MINETIRLVSVKNIMVKFYLISLSAMPSNNHLTKIMKMRVNNEDKFAQIKSKEVRFKQNNRALKKNKNINIDEQ
jgi:hypothetical protein